MKTKWFLLAGTLSLALNGAMAQAWDQGGNNVIVASDYLGCDGASTVPLKVMHNAGDQPIEIFSTGDAVPEVFLAPAITGFSYAGATGLDLSGNLGVGPDFPRPTLGCGSRPKGSGARLET